jgi:8-oxo-dGTP diphosphatase
MANPPRVGVGSYILKDGQVLLGYRTTGHASGVWSAPGGHIEHGESPADAAAREALEECGLDIPSAKWQLRAITNDLFSENQTHYFTFALVATITEGEPEVREPYKLREWRWFDPHTIMTPFANARSAGFDLTNETTIITNF